MQFIRQHKIFKLFWFMMAALFINTSVDPVDPHGDWVAEDLSVNEMETIIEIVAEQILDIEDCFEERDDKDPDDSAPVKPVKDISEIEPSKVIGLKSPPSLVNSHSQPDYFKRFRSQFDGEVNDPPPKPTA